MKDITPGNNFILMISAILLVFFIGVQGQAQPARPPGDRSQQSPMGPPAEADRLEHYFQKALDDISQKNGTDAAAELKEAAALLEAETRMSANDAQKRLTGSAQEMKQLAGDLMKEKGVPEEKIRYTFARAHLAMAQNDQLKASASGNLETGASLDRYLQGAADHLEKAWYWSGRQLETAAKGVIDRSRQLGRKIDSKVDGAVADAAKSIEELGQEIGRLWRMLVSENAPQVTFAATLPENGSGNEMNTGKVDLTTAVMQVAKKNIPTVVHITVTERQEVPNLLLPFEKNPFFRRYFGLPKKMPKKFERELVGVGSGIIIDPEGHILTNNHVVGGATKIQVMLSDGTTYSAKVLGTDPKTDLGVIKISADDPLPFAMFGDSDRVEVGQWVVAIGQPESLSESVSQGVISAKHRTGITDPSTYQDFLQTDAAINPGNSGGPLLDLQGNVIGINSAIFSTTGGFQGIGFSIPSKMAAHVANALMKYGKVERGWLGVSLQELTPKLAQSFGLSAPKGALVAQVMNGGPADKAGLKSGDVVTAMQGKPIADVAEIRNAIADMPVGQEVDLTVLRDGKSMNIKVKIGNLEEMSKQLAASLKKRLGILVKPIPDLEASAYGLPSTGGVIIQWVDPKGPLGRIGFEVDDIILAVDNQPVENVETFTNLIDSLPEGKAIVLIVRDHRTGQVGSVQVKMG